MFYKKSVSSLLIVCLIFSALSGLLMYPKKVKAGLPVEIIADVGDMMIDWINLAKNILTSIKTAIIAGVQIWDKVNKLAEQYLGKFLYGIVEGLLAELTNEMVDWLNNGTEPRFLSMDFDDWLMNTGNKISGIFIEQYLGAGWLCDSFYDQLNDMFKLKLEIPSKFTGFDYFNDVDCTIEDVLNNAGSSVEEFKKDFSKGNWEAWVEITETENNFLTVYAESIMEELDMRAQAEEQQEKELAMNDGYQNHKKCIWYGFAVPFEQVDDDGTISEEERETVPCSPDWCSDCGDGNFCQDVVGTPNLPQRCIADLESDELGKTIGGFYLPCDYECEVLTPGSTVKDMSSKTITNYWDQLNNELNALLEKAGPLAVVIRKVAETLIGQFFEESSEGLRGAKEIKGSGDLDSEVDPYGQVIDLVTQLEVLKDLMNKDMDVLQLAEENANKYQEIIDYYTNYTIPALEKIIDECPNSTEAKWAQKKLDKIKDEILPRIQKKIARYDKLVIAKVKLTKAVTQLKIYMEDPKNNEQAKADGIKYAQKALKLIAEVTGGEFDGSNFTGLINTAKKLALEDFAELPGKLHKERMETTAEGIPAEMELAKGIKNDADDKLDDCSSDEGDDVF